MQRTKNRPVPLNQAVVQHMERETGIEPATSSLGSLRSTPELLPLPKGNVVYHLKGFSLKYLFKINALSLTVNNKNPILSMAPTRRFWPGIVPQFARKPPGIPKPPDPATASDDPGGTR